MRALRGLKKMVPPSTDLPRVLCLKGFWAFCMRADVSQCFHRDSTGADTTTGVADTTAGTAVSQKNAERFTENGERFSENGERFFLCTAISLLATANTATATAIPHAGTAISRTYLMCERFVKRSWNVGNAPAHPRPLYLLGF
jgi:hypothetical protein